MERLKTIFNNLINRWGSFKRITKIAIAGIGLGTILVFIVIVALSARPRAVALFTNPVTDQTLLEKISLRLEEDDISYNVRNNIIYVETENKAREIRAILFREDLVPRDTDPWELFDVTRWTQTDFERNINLQRAITRQLEQHIEALEDVDNASVTIVIPEETLFSSEQDPVSASVILTLKPGSDLRENKTKIAGIESLILFAVEGLTVEYLSINDLNGIKLNDFTNLADFDRLAQTERELSIENEIENKYKRAIFKALGDIYTVDRVRIVNIDVDLDFGKKTSETTENFPITVRKDNPQTPFDESEVTLSIPRSTEDISENYEGTGFNPEGPPGVEGQVPPTYQDLDGVVGKWNYDQKKVNNEINQVKTLEEKSPEVKRITASIAIDGIWEREFDAEGNIVFLPNGAVSRMYIPLERTELRKALALVQNAVSYSLDRGDSVSVENIQFDRSAQFELEDAKYRRRQLAIRYTTYILIGIGILILLFIIIRLIMRFFETLRNIREERLAEQYKRIRERQIMQLDESDEDASAESDLERMTREIVELVKEKPKDLALLISSWMEEDRNG